MGRTDINPDEETLKSVEGEEMPSEQPMLFCPNCDERLTSRHCKLLCERCGYFMSCADYY